MGGPDPLTVFTSTPTRSKTTSAPRVGRARFVVAGGSGGESQGRLGPMVEGVLAELVGLQWEDLNRAADMVTLGFGELVAQPPLRPMPTLRPELRERLQRSNADVYRAAETPHRWLEDDDRQTVGAPLFDQRAARFGAGALGKQSVTSVSADSGGGFALELSGGWGITVVPSSAAVHEFWRYFHADGGPHFVLFERD